MGCKVDRGLSDSFQRLIVLLAFAWEAANSKCSRYRQQNERDLELSLLSPLNDSVLASAYLQMTQFQLCYMM